MAGAALLTIVTRRGAYVSPDGLFYVGTARNLVDGAGYQPPPGSPSVSNFPPLYPLLLAGVGFLGPDPLTVARFVGPVLFGVLILVTGVVVHRTTGSLVLAAAAQLLVLGGVDFLAYSSSALSEPLFLVLALLALAAVAACLGRRRSGLLLVAAALAGAASLTRYVGLAVVAGGALALLLLSRRRPRWWAEPVAFTAVALAPVLGWLAWVEGTEGRATNREAVWHPPGWSYLTGGLRAASAWVLPEQVSWPAGAILGAVVAVVLAAVVWRHRSDAGAAPSRTTAVLGLFSLAYAAALFVDRLLFDVTGRLDARFLLPLHLAAIAAGVRALRDVDIAATHVARIGLSAVVGLQVAAGTAWAWDGIRDPAVRPAGFTAPAWNRSEVIDEARAAAPERPLYTNQVDALWFHTGRVAAPVPEKRTFLTGELNPDYLSLLATMAQDLRNGGLLVYFTAVPARRAFLPTPTELADTLNLSVVVQDGVGVAYRYAARVP